MGGNQSGENSKAWRAVFTGMAVLILSMVFFSFDILADIFDHFALKKPYNAWELVHLIFEIVAVVGLGFGALTLRGRLVGLRSYAERAAETIEVMRGHFEEVLEMNFSKWGLTKAERDITLLIVRGLTVAQIAEARSTAQGTIKAQSTSIFRKIGVSSKTELLSLIIDEFIDQPAI